MGCISRSDNGGGGGGGIYSSHGRSFNLHSMVMKAALQLILSHY